MIQWLYRTEDSEKQAKNFSFQLTVFGINFSCLTLRSGECVQAKKYVEVSVFCWKDKLKASHLPYISVLEVL